MGRKTEDETTPKEVKLPDFVIFPFELIQANLKPNELRVLLCLYSFRGKSTNTVWPKLETVASRLGKPSTYTTEISRAISSLRKKGYLKTKKHARGNNYDLCLPEENPDLVETPQDVIESQLEPSEAPENTGIQAIESKLGEDLVEIPQDVEKLQESLVETPQDIVVEIPQGYKNSKTNNTNKHNKFYKTPALNKFDFSTWPAWPSEETLKDWIAVRKGKRLALTQTAINQMAKEIHLAVTNGLTVDSCLAECCSAGWAGFKFEWYCNRNKPQLQAAAGFGGRPVQSTRERSLSQDLKDIDW